MSKVVFLIKGKCLPSFSAVRTNLQYYAATTVFYNRDGVLKVTFLQQTFLHKGKNPCNAFSLFSKRFVVNCQRDSCGFLSTKKIK